MLGGLTPLVTVLGAAPDATAETPRIKAYAKELVRAGLHVLLIEPGTKLPVDMRSGVKIRQDDEAAQDKAKAEGRPDWMKARAMAGVYLATNDETLITRYIDAYRKRWPGVGVNMAVAVGPSRLIIVDCDTKEQTDAFINDLGLPAGTQPTVKSPGALRDGQWVHKDGGHFWFRLGETDEVNQEMGSFTAPGGYAVLWGNRYVLIPPSVRPEGAYYLAGQDLPATSAMVDTVNGLAMAKVAARRDAAPDPELASAVDTWSDSITWADLLAPAGWTLHNRADNCGCDIWTAPGDHHSPKSATTHDANCGLGRYSPNAPLHIWTDNPGELLEAWCRANGKTMSKLQVASVLEFGGDMGTAMKTIGVLPDLSFGPSREDGSSPAHLADVVASPANLDRELPPLPKVEPAALKYDQGGITEVTYTGVPLRVGDVFTAAHVAMLEGEGFKENADGRFRSTNPDDDRVLLVETTVDNVIAGFEINGQPYTLISLTPLPAPVAAFANPMGDALPPEVEAESDAEVEVQGVPIIRPFGEWRDYPAPEFAIEGLLEHRGFTALIGMPGVGKSAVALDIAASLTKGIPWQGRRTMRQNVLYLPGEGLAGAVHRLKAWEAKHDLDVGTDLYVGDSIIQVAASPEAWAKVIEKILEFQIGMVMIDTFARSAVGLEENSATDVGKAIRRFDQVRERTGCGLMVVHHTNKTSTSGRGSSALNGALDTELLILEREKSDDEAMGRGVGMAVSKQKNAEFEPGKIIHDLLLSPFADSVVITGPTGQVGDVFDTVIAPKAIIPESLVETAIRIADYAERFPSQGLTRGECLLGVVPDAWTLQRRDSKPLWKARIAEAVDWALTNNLLETLTGTASGSRYIPGPVTPAQARATWASQGLTD